MRGDRTLSPGDIVAERFRIEREAGRGGMGTVYLARELSGGAQVALKVLRPDVGPEVERFRRESELLSSLGHPAIVRYIDHGLDGVVPWLAMEWLEGQSLSEALRLGPLSEPDAVAMVCTIAEALGRAHAGQIVHRDVKPGNIFLVGGSPRNARVLDFGIARSLGPDARTLTTTGTVLGTAAYMAPEQARAANDLDARIDVWALGCVLYESVSGRKPFDQESLIAVLAAVLLEEPRPLSEVAPHVSRALGALVRELLDKDREKRPSSGTELARRLDALASDRSEGPERAVPRGITSRERRVVCVVLAQAPERAASAATGQGAGWNLEVSASRDDTEGALRAAASAHGGKTELLADGTLVVTLDDTGTPTDQAERAARLALAMRSAAPYAALVLCAGRAEIHGRVPVGEVVDRGARLLRREGALGAVALDEVAAGLLDARFEVTSSDGDTLLRALRADDTARVTLDVRLPFVGRDREAAALLALAEESRTEAVARVALVAAGPGAGKTRLADELVRQILLEAPDTQIWVVRGEPLARGAPFSIAARLVRAAAGIALGEPLSERRRKLVGLVERVMPGPRAGRAAALLGEIARAPFDDDGDEALAAARRDSLVLADLVHRAFSDWLGAEAAAKPVVLVMDDLHTIDAASVGLVDAAVRENATRSLFVLGLYRTDDAPPGALPFAEREPQRVSLKKLVSRHCRTLAAAALGGDAASEHVEALAARCDGSPFFLEEMARAMKAGRGDAVPVSVLGIVEDRIGELPARARRTLRAASVLGAGAPRDALLRLLPDSPAAELDLDLAMLEREELLVRDADPRSEASERWSFRQPLVREAAYAMLTDDDRRLAHRLASDVVRSEPEHDPALLAEHLERAGLGAEAALALVRATERALLGHDLEGAVALATRGLALESPPARGELLSVMARALRWQGKYGVAFGAAKEVLDAAELGTRYALDAAATLFSSATALGRGAETRDLWTALEALSVEPALRATLVVVLARASATALAAGDAGARQRLQAHAHQIAAELTEPDALVDAWLAVLDASVAFEGGDIGGFAVATERAAAAYHRAGDVRDAVNQAVRLGNAWVALGLPERAEPTLRQAAEEARRMGLRVVEAYAWQNLGHAQLRLGQRGEAQAAIERAVAAGASLRDARLEAGSRLYLVDALGAAGRTDLAMREAERAVALLVEAPVFRIVALAALARTALEAGAPARALAAAEEALDALRAPGVRLEEGDALVFDALAGVLDAAGRGEEASVVARSALERVESRARLIVDSTLRASFLERVPEHVRLRRRLAGAHVR